MNEARFTANGFQMLEAEHARLRIKREALVERMRSALELGGAPRENGVYLDARHELDLLDRRLSLLDERLVRAEVVAPRNDGEVDLGERVTVIDLESGDTVDYRVVGSFEGDPLGGEISYESPIGAALLGRRVGDVVEAAAPAGRRRLEIVELDG
jgi:transcription elongation factor GreA